MLRNIALMRRHPPAFLAQCANRYGPVVRFPMPRSEVWLLSGPDDVRGVLQGNHKAYGKRTLQYDTLVLVTGTGLLASDADLWLRMRRIMSPGFHHDLVASMATVVHEACAAWVERVLGAESETELDLDAAMLELTLDIVATTLLGGPLAGRADDLVKAVMAALRVVVAKAQQPLPIPDSWPTRGHRRLRHSMSVLDAAVDDIIDTRRSAAPGTDALWLLISALDEGLASEKEIRDEVVTLIVAGHETVAATLTWSWVLLAAHPEAERRVYAEVAALPDPATHVWDADVLERLPYTRAVVHECLRLYPPAWVTTRRSLEADVVGGFDLPVGATVILSPYAMHRDQQWWTNPERFDPKRFLGDSSPAEAGSGPLTYFPFGAGPRLCIGRDLALMEAPMVIAALARALRIRPLRPSAVCEDFGVTLRPRGGLPAVVTTRC